MATTRAGAGEWAKRKITQSLGGEVVGGKCPQKAKSSGDDIDHRRSKLA